ncbi:unnamed protein product, partial [Symbiodinium sp. CCMP2456]
VSKGAEPGEGSCATDAAKVVPGHRRDLLQSAIGDAVELLELAGHGEEGYVWRGRLGLSGQEVAVKFRCDQEECQGGTVNLRGHAQDLLRECYAGSEAFRRAPQYVSGCFEDPTDDAMFIVLHQVPLSFVLVENSVDDFVKADKATHHGLLRQLLRAVCRFLDPVDGRSLVHNDLTAANIMRDPNSMQLTIMDFSQEIVLVASMPGPGAPSLPVAELFRSSLDAGPFKAAAARRMTRFFRRYEDYGLGKYARYRIWDPRSFSAHVRGESLDRAGEGRLPFRKSLSMEVNDHAVAGSTHDQRRHGGTRRLWGDCTLISLTIFSIKAVMTVDRRNCQLCSLEM